MGSFLKYLATAAVFTSFAFAANRPRTSSSITLSPRDEQLVDEAFYLVECDYYSGGQLSGTRDYWVDASDDIKFRSSDQRGEATVLSAPAADHQDHDGFLYHMNWTDGTADYPLGTTFDGHYGFSVWGLRPSYELLPDDGTVNGSEFHLLPGWRSVDAVTWLDSTKMQCYGENYTLPNDVINYGECVARASDVFDHVKETIKKSQGNSVGYDIGDTGCKIHFNYKTTNASNDKFADPDLATHVADLMQKVAAARVGKTQHTYDGECVDDLITQGRLCAPCTSMTYPKEGYLSREVSDLKSRGSNNGIWLEISNVEFMVECDAQCSGDKGLWDFIGTAATAVSVGAGFFEGAEVLGAWATVLGDVAGDAPSCRDVSVSC